MANNQIRALLAGCKMMYLFNEGAGARFTDIIGGNDAKCISPDAVTTGRWLTGRAGSAYMSGSSSYANPVIPIQASPEAYEKDEFSCVMIFAMQSKTGADMCGRLGSWGVSYDMNNTKIGYAYYGGPAAYILNLPDWSNATDLQCFGFSITGSYTSPVLKQYWNGELKSSGPYGYTIAVAPPNGFSIGSYFSGAPTAGVNTAWTLWAYWSRILSDAEHQLICHIGKADRSLFALEANNSFFHVPGPAFLSAWAGRSNYIIQPGMAI